MMSKYACALDVHSLADIGIAGSAELPLTRRFESVMSLVSPSQATVDVFESSLLLPSLLILPKRSLILFLPPMGENFLLSDLVSRSLSVDLPDCHLARKSLRVLSCQCCVLVSLVPSPVSNPWPVRSVSVRDLCWRVPASCGAKGSMLGVEVGSFLGISHTDSLR